MAKPRSERDLVQLTGFPAGMNNVAPETRLPVDENGIPVACRDAVNVDFDKAGRFRRRPGYTKVFDGTNVHSLFGHRDFPSMLVRAEASLYALTPAGATTEIATGLGLREASYASLGRDVAWTVENLRTGRVSPALGVRPLGVPTPPGVPALTAVAAGALFAGRYQVALSYMLASGEEGGTCYPDVIDVDANGGIVVTLPVPSDLLVTAVRVWCSEANGAELYHVRDVSAGTTSYTIGAGARGKSASELGLIGLEPLPPGHILRELNGILWMAWDNQVFYCEPMRPGLTHLGHNRIPYHDRITMMQPVGQASNAGMYVAAGGRTYFHAGATPKRVDMQQVYPYGAVPGTGCTVPASFFGSDYKGEAAYWMASNGVPVLGLPGGTVVPLADNTVAMTRFDRGASFVRQVNGIRQAIIAGSGGHRNEFAARDRAVVRHMRNGIPVP